MSDKQSQQQQEIITQSTQQQDDSSEELQSTKKRDYRGYLCVISGICIHLVCGNLYLWGNISNYVISHFHYLGDSNANLQIAVGVLPVSFTIQSLIQPLGAYLQKRINPKLILLVGGSTILGSIYIASNVRSWWAFVFFYCCCFPLGIGICYWTPIMCCWEWFPNNKGLVSGLVVGGFGFGSFIFGFISTAIANPDDLKPDYPHDGFKDKLFPLDVAENVPDMFHFCLRFWLILVIVAILGVSRNPEYVRKEELRERTDFINRTNNSLDETQPVNFVTYKEGLKSKQFYHLGMMLFFGMFFGVFMASVYKTTAQDFLSDHTLTLAGAIGSVCNGGSRIFWATLQDKLGFRKVYFCLLALQLVISLTIYYVRKDPTVYVIWVSLAFLCEGGHFSMFPTATVKLFGIQNGGQLFTIMFFFIPASSILGFLIVHFGQNLISFEFVFQISGALTSINIILLYYFNDGEIKSQRTRQWESQSLIPMSDISQDTKEDNQYQQIQ